MLFETSENFVFIPTSISIYGVISGQTFLFGLLICYYFKHYYLLIIIFCLYFTTVLFWRKLHYFSFLKMMDVLLAITTVLLITFYYSPTYFKPYYRYVWNYFMVFLTIVFLISEYIFYSKCMLKDNNESSFNFYPLIYTNEYSKERELEYYRSVLTHCVFLHIMPIFVYFYCCYNSLR